MNAGLSLAAGVGLGGVIVAGLWLWEQHGLAVWLEAGLAWCL